MPYLLTVSRTDYSARKLHWADPSYDPGVRMIGSPQMPLPYPGAMVLVDDDGCIREAVPLFSPKGMALSGDRLLVACYTEIRSFNLALTESFPLVKAAWCNDLHSLRATSRGFLVAGTGVDVLVEFDPQGRELWRWWAVDHGFPDDIEGRPWSLGRDVDHSRRVYPVDLQSVHINAVAELGPDTFVASPLHRDSLISIDRSTGSTRVLMNDLPQPHAVRVLHDDLITFADTRSGEGVLARVEDGKVNVLSRVSVETDWLQDAFYDGREWTLVDGANCRVLHTDADGNILRVDSFDKEWCLSETLPWRDPRI